MTGHAPPPCLDEIARQREVLEREGSVRFATTALAYGLSSLFLPWQVPAACAAVNLAGELASLGLMRDLDPQRQRGRYRACLLWVFLLELAFVMPAALIWQMDGPYVKAFAVGMAAATLMHLTTVRSIHLPFGIAGLSAVALATLSANIASAWQHQSTSLFLIATVSAFGALSYALGAMLSNNSLHRSTARGQAAAQAASMAKGRFLAQMSHELRTPLNAILGVGRAERDRATDPLSRDRLGVLIASAEGLSTILDDILDLSAVQEGRLPIRPQTTVPGEVIEATVALFRPGIEEAGLSLTVDIARDLFQPARFDPQRLRQCLSNVLSNAVKQTARGGIALRARREPRGTADALLRIEVSDSGPGIPADLREAIFEPFSHGMQPIGAPGGRGLGLSISRGLARQMGGDLTLAPPGTPDLLGPTAAAWDSGACFVLTIALAAPPVAAPAPPDPATAGLRGKRVLVIDDIASNRMVAVIYLRMLGALPEEAASGAEALDRLARDPTDLVLLDMNMPEMSGLETLQRLRALPGAAARLPVVAMTADAMEDQRRAYLDAGLDGYLTKPLAPDALARELARHLPPPAAQPA